jgi:L-ascorbate 6-phosphate lactonase
MGELRITWLGQGGFLLRDGTHTLCIDPYLSDAVNRVAGRPRLLPPPIAPEALRADAVVCTHNHLDHVDIDAIPKMPLNGMRFYAPRDAKATLLECGVRQYTPFDEGESFTLGAFRVTAVPAKHSCPAIGLLVRHGDHTLYVSGDTEYDERLEQLRDAHVDVMFICINGKLGNMNVQEAIRLTERIDPRVGVPMHYGMFASNTEDPKSYTTHIPHGFEMKYGRETPIKEILEHV